MTPLHFKILLRKTARNQFCSWWKPLPLMEWISKPTRGGQSCLAQCMKQSSWGQVQSKLMLSATSPLSLQRQLGTYQVFIYPHKFWYGSSWHCCGSRTRPTWVYMPQVNLQCLSVPIRFQKRRQHLREGTLCRDSYSRLQAWGYTMDWYWPSKQRRGFLEWMSCQSDSPRKACPVVVWGTTLPIAGELRVCGSSMMTFKSS